MRRWLIGTLCGLLAAAGLSAYAVTVGGFPSFPWFQAVGVGEAAPATVGELAAKSAVFSNDVSLGNIQFDSNTASDAQIQAALGSGTYAGVAILSNSSGTSTQENTAYSSWTLDIGGRASDNSNYSSSDADAFTIFRVPPGGSYLTASGQPFFRINASGSITTPGAASANFPQATYIGGSLIQTAAATLITTSSSCTLGAGTGSVNVASCSRSSPGLYVVNFSKTFARVPVCVFNAASGTRSGLPDAAADAGNTATYADVYVTNLSGTIVDGDTISMVCQ